MSETIMQSDERIAYTIPAGKKMTFDPTWSRLVGRDIVQKKDGSAYERPDPVMKRRYDNHIVEAVLSEVFNIELGDADE